MPVSHYTAVGDIGPYLAAIKKLHAQKSVMVAHTKSADEFWRELRILTTLDCPRVGSRIQDAHMHSLCTSH